MNKLKIIVIFLLSTLMLMLLVLAQPCALAATYYLDAVNGDDDDPGTSGEPWQTLNRAYTWYSGTGTPKVQEGDTVLFRNGTYGGDEGFQESTQTSLSVLFRNNWITYRAASGHAPIIKKVEIHNENRSNGDGHGRSYLIIEGFMIPSGVSIQYTSYVQVKNCVITFPATPYQGFYAPYLLPNRYGVSGRSAQYITIEGNTITDVYRGIKPNGSNWIIKDNHIYNIAEDGINGAPNNLIIQGNHIHDTTIKRTTIALHGSTSGTFVEGETVIQAGTGAEGIAYKYADSGYLQVWQTNTNDFKPGSGNGGTVTGLRSGATVSNIINVDPAHADSIHIESATVRNIAINGNTLHNAGGQGIVLYGHGGMADVVVTNNLVYDIAKSMVISGVRGVDIYNNTTSAGYVRMECTSSHSFISVINNMYNNIFSRLVINDDAGGSYIRVINHGNNIFGNDPDGSSSAYPFRINGTERVNAIPEFVDLAGRNFRLARGSEAIGFGDPAHAPATDILGNSRDAYPDAGCYEWDGAPPPPPGIELGDVTGNGEISSYDASLAAQHSIGLINLPPDAVQRADVTGNSEISSYDASLIAQYAIGLIDGF